MTSALSLSPALRCSSALRRCQALLYAASGTPASPRRDPQAIKQPLDLALLYSHNKTPLFLTEHMQNSPVTAEGGSSPPDDLQLPSLREDVQHARQSWHCWLVTPLLTPGREVTTALVPKWHCKPPLPWAGSCQPLLSPDLGQEDGTLHPPRSPPVPQPGALGYFKSSSGRLAHAPCCRELPASVSKKLEAGSLLGLTPVIPKV